jgi:hypothetical protein
LIVGAGFEAVSTGFAWSVSPVSPEEIAVELFPVGEIAGGWLREDDGVASGAEMGIGVALPAGVVGCAAGAAVAVVAAGLAVGEPDEDDESPAGCAVAPAGGAVVEDALSLGAADEFASEFWAADDGLLALGLNHPNPWFLQRKYPMPTAKASATRIKTSFPAPPRFGGSSSSSR